MLKEARAKQCLGDFEIQMFKICRQAISYVHMELLSVKDVQLSGLRRN